MKKTIDYYHGPSLPRQPTADIKWGILLAVMGILHVAMMLINATPFVDLCILLFPIGSYFWPVVAIAIALWMVARAADRNIGKLRRLRLSIAALLFLLAVDTLTGGNYRWFELSMRHEIANVGGSAALQTWAQNSLSSPVMIAAFDAAGGGLLNPTQVPPTFQHWFGHTGPLYRMSIDGGPAFQFDDGGWDMGWGVIVGRTDLKAVFPRGINGGSCWIKQIQPGVFLYAFQ